MTSPWEAPYKKTDYDEMETVEYIKVLDDIIKKELPEMMSNYVNHFKNLGLPDYMIVTALTMSIGHLYNKLVKGHGSTETLFRVMTDLEKAPTKSYNPPPHLTVRDYAAVYMYDEISQVLSSCEKQIKDLDVFAYAVFKSIKWMNETAEKLPDFRAMKACAQKPDSV